MFTKLNTRLHLIIPSELNPHTSEIIGQHWCGFQCKRSVRYCNH